MASALSRTLSSTPLIVRAGSGVQGGSTVFVGPFIARPLTLRTARYHRVRTKRRFVVTGILLRRLTKTPLLESCGGSQLPTNHLCDPQQRTMIHPIRTPLLFPEEAGRSIKKTIGFRLPRDLPGCPAWEPATRAALFLAASHTAAPPTFVRWLPSPPHGRGETSIADSLAAIPDRISRPSGLLRPANSAAWSCLVCLSHSAVACLHYCSRSDSAQITHQLPALREAFDWPNRQYERQCRHRPHAWLCHQAHGRVAT